MLRSRLLSLLVLGFAAWSSSPLAQTSPTSILGHPLGESFTRHHAMVDYVAHMADVMPHWQLEAYGTTTEGRPLLGLIMSSPDNMANLETLRANNMRRVNEGVDSGDRVVWVYLSYNVHGNEAVCTEAAMAPSKPRNHPHPLLDRTVVVMDPCVNPDGRDRYVHFKTSRAVPVPIPSQGWEHDEPWPGGRPNHYV